MGFKVVEIQATPNPNAAKFVLDRPICEQPMSFFNVESAGKYPLAMSLFAVEGVSSLLFLGDFVTVNKTSDSNWKQITPKVKKVLAEAP